MIPKLHQPNTGYAIIIVLVVITVSFTMAMATAVITLSNLQTSSQITQSQKILNAAESGVQNAILTLNRNPSYTGETFTIDDVQITIQITQGSNTTITSRASRNDYARTIQVIGAYNNLIFQPSSWQEIP